MQKRKCYITEMAVVRGGSQTRGLVKVGDEKKEEPQQASVTLIHGALRHALTTLSHRLIEV